MKTIRKSCLFCNKEFDASLKEVNRGYGKYCSISCCVSQTHKLHPKNSNCICALCGKEFHRRKSSLSKSKSGLFFCCREHKDQGQRLENNITAIHPPRYGKGMYHASYRAIAFRNHPNLCNKCGYSKYTEVLVVHHKNRDRKNNTIDNLEILCPTCHEEEHFLSHDGRWSSPN